MGDFPGSPVVKIPSAGALVQSPPGSWIPRTAAECVHPSYRVHTLEPAHLNKDPINIILKRELGNGRFREEEHALEIKSMVTK